MGMLKCQKKVYTAGTMGVEFIPFCFSIAPSLYLSLFAVQIWQELSVKWQLKASEIPVWEYYFLAGYLVTHTGST